MVEVIVTLCDARLWRKSMLRSFGDKRNEHTNFIYGLLDLLKSHATFFISVSTWTFDSGYSQHTMYLMCRHGTFSYGDCEQNMYIPFK